MCLFDIDTLGAAHRNWIRQQIEQLFTRIVLKSEQHIFQHGQPPEDPELLKRADHAPARDRMGR
jgi:hypothetical protein